MKRKRPNSCSEYWTPQNGNMVMRLICTGPTSNYKTKYSTNGKPYQMQTDFINYKPLSQRCHHMLRDQNQYLPTRTQDNPYFLMTLLQTTAHTLNLEPKQ
uniref:Uncharacterized protein n=1 Tax=Cacopsylla melanoneura TaxID=428564 RepID=A0A8D8PPD8_9HEMI